MSKNVATKSCGNNDDFLSLETNVGDALQLQDMAQGKHRYYTKLIGYLNKQSLIVTHPKLDGKLIAANVGEAFLVRGFADRITYEFTAKVLQISTQPFAYLHLSYPEKVASQEMRGAMRIKTKLASSVIANVNGLKMPATIADLSTSGANIQSPVNLGKNGDAVRIQFRLAVDSEEQTLMMSAIIRNAGVPDDANSVTYGVEFVGTTNCARIALQTYVYSILIDRQSD